MLGGTRMSTTTAARPRIRQNPRVSAGKTPAGENCLRHGWYPLDWQVSSLIDEARGHPGVRPERARTLMERAERLRRHCPACGGQRPTDGEYLIELRGRCA